MKVLRIFISSPGDVGTERLRAYEVVKRLQTKFSAFLKLEAFLWDHEPMRATASFQNQIPKPSDHDIVICILWSKIGTALSQDYKRPDGTIPTGTEWEFEDAYEAYKAKGTPDLFVYRKTGPLSVDLLVTGNAQQLKEQLEALQQQKESLDAFLNRWFRDHEGAFKAAFKAFRTDEDFEKFLAEDLEKIIQEKIPLGPIHSTWFGGSPFRGLNTFQPEHEPIFFGRDLATFEIIKRLQAQAAKKSPVFVMVLGMSGCGKSSLVRAGVLPKLKRPGVIENVGCWRWAILRPGEIVGTLIEGLAASLLGRAALPELSKFGCDSLWLAAQLGDNPARVFPQIKAALEEAARSLAKESLRSTLPDARLVLIVDQLEEIFTLERFNSNQRAAFAAAIATLSRSGLVWVIATMRSDLYARCAEIDDFTTFKYDDGQYDLTPPSVSEIGQMIRMPAQAGGLHFEQHPISYKKLDDALLEEASSNPEALPLLEFCLDELYKLKTEANVITWHAYEILGGLKGAIAKRAEEVYNGLSVEAQEMFPAILGSLITVGETATSNPAIRKDLVNHSGGTEIVDAFLKANLFVSHANRSGEAVLALAHEALITNWPRVQNWLEDNRDFLRVRERIVEADRRWREFKRDNSYLLVEGKPLAEAEDALKKHHKELTSEIVEFVEISAKFIAHHRRRRRLLAAGMLTIILSLIFGCIILWQVRQKLDARKETVTASRATSETDFALAADQVQKHNTRVALAYLADALQKNSNNTKATALALSLLRDCPMPLISLSHKDEVQDANFSPDGTIIVTASADGSAQLWNALTGSKIGKPMMHKDWVHTAAFSRSGDWVVTASWDGTARVWNGRTGEARTNLNTGQPVVMNHGTNKVTTAYFSPDGELVATACWDGKARIWNAKTGEPILNPLTAKPIELSHSNIVWTVGFSPDGRRLVTASADKTARVWDVRSGEPVTNMEGAEIVLTNADEVNGASFSPDGKLIVTGSDDGMVGIWDVATGTNVFEMKHALSVNPPSFSPDGSRIVTASSDNTAQVWDVKKGTSVGKVMRHEGGVRIARFSPDGRLVVTASSDGTARVWDAETGMPVSNPLYHGSAVYMANFSPDGRLVVTASFDNFARIWVVQSGEGDKLLDHKKEVESAVFSPNSLRVVTASRDGTASVWNAQTGELMFDLMRSINGVTNGVLAAKFSPDAKRIITTFADGSAQLWDAFTGSKIGDPIIGVDSKITAEDFSSNGNQIVTGSTDGSARLWNGLTGEALTNTQTHERLILYPHTSSGFKIYYASFSPDGHLIVTASADGNARIWNAHTGELLQELKHDGIVFTARFSSNSSFVLTASADHRAHIWDIRGTIPTDRQLRHDGWVYDAEFSPDGKMVVTASSDGTARVWNAQTGQPISEPMRHDNGVITATFSPDGRWVVTASLDGTARIWDSQTGKAISGAMPDLGDWNTNKDKTASFSPDGKWIVTASDDNTARIWESAITESNAPSWLERLSEDVGGLHLNSQRILERVTQNPTQIREELGKLVGDDDVSRFARWVVADPATRTISPLSSMTIPAFVEQKLEENTLSSLDEAYDAAPGDPIILASLAKFETNTDEELFYCRLALTRSQAENSPEQIKRVKAIADLLFPNQSEFVDVTNLSPLMR